MPIGVTKKRFAINVVMNWAATAVNMVIPFFLTPFVVHHLGSTAYGVWIIAVSTTSYLALLDLGLRSAVIRFVSKANAQGQLADATKYIGAAVWFRLMVVTAIIPLAAVAALLSPHFFNVPPEMQRALQITILLCATGVAATMVSGVFGAVLSALNRFDLLSSVTVAQTIFRAGGVLLLLRHGHGLIALAWWDASVIVAAGLALFVIACVKFPAARTRIRRPGMDVLKPLWSYSATTFVFMISVQVIWNTDSIVIGSLLSVSLVTFYSIGSSLVMYSGQVAQAISTTFTPLASGLEASGRSADLQRMLIRGTQAMLAFSLPIAVALFFRGETFISLWMGPMYAQRAETVCRILMISFFFSMANATAASLVMAIEKHGPMARWAVFEAVLNLGLSLVLAKTIGLYGVAWGTTISIALVHMLFWPRYVKKTLGVAPAHYIWEGWAKVTLCTVPFGIVCVISEHFLRAPNLAVFFLQILATLPVYLVSLLLVFRDDAKTAMLKWRAA